MIIEATKNLPDLDQPFAIQSTFNDFAIWRKITMHIPLLRQLLINRAIRSGAIYLRPYKKNPALPPRYRVGMWVVHNTSQREDGVYGKVGFAILKFPRWRLKDW